MIEPRRIVEAVKMPLLLGVVLLIALYAILLGLLFASQGMDTASQEIIGYISTFLPYILFFPLFLWTGYRTARKYGSELLEAGVVAAILAALIKIIEFVIGLFIGLIVILIISGGLMDGEMGDIGAFFGMMMFGGVMIGALICAIQLASTIPVNFLVGLIGAYIAGARKLVEQKKEVKRPEKQYRKRPRKMK